MPSWGYIAIVILVIYSVANIALYYLQEYFIFKPEKLDKDFQFHYNNQVVPYASGKKLFNSIHHSNKRMISIDGGSHNDLIDFKGYTETIDGVLEKK